MNLGLYVLIKSIIVSLFATNCYIVGCEKTGEAAIIDPGDEPDRILDLVNAHNLKVTKIINTHAHLDHVGAVADIKDKTGASFLLHRDELQILDSLEDQAMFFDVKHSRIPKVDDFLSEETPITVGTLEFQVLYTPGHTPGGVCFLSDTILFSGDTLFQGSIGRTDFPGGSFTTIINSIKKKLLTLDPRTRVLCGHGPETAIKFEKDNNPFLH